MKTKEMYPVIRIVFEVAAAHESIVELLNITDIVIIGLVDRVQSIEPFILQGSVKW
jgi:hypothetical protein